MLFSYYTERVPVFQQPSKDEASTERLRNFVSSKELWGKVDQSQGY